MHTDSAYTIGRSHEVCQDYTRSGHTGFNDVHFALVCDGCSSSANSDVGARVLALEASKRVRSAAPPKPFSTAAADALGTRIIVPASTRIQDLGLPAESLDATLFMTLADADTARFVSFGDGVLLLMRADGDIRYTRISYESGYPYYPTYALDIQRELQFMDKNQAGCLVELGDIHLATPDTPCVYGMHTTDAAMPHCYNIGTTPTDNVPLILAAVLSDGVESFTRKTDNGVESVPLHEVLRLLCQFKTYTGRFVQRRLNRFLRDAEKLGWRHADDLSMAAIHLGDCA